MRDRCAALRTLFQYVCTLHRNRIGQLSPFSEYAPTAGWIKPKSTATFKGACYPPVSGGRDRCREAVAARASCALSRPAAPMCPPPNGAHAWGKSSVGDTFIPTKSATPAIPHTYLVRRVVRVALSSRSEEQPPQLQSR